MIETISVAEIDALKKYNRAANYLAVSQIYLQDNVLLTHPLKFSDIKVRLLGHWGTVPGINFVYSHINRLIIQNSAKFLYVVGPGHGFPGIQANLFIEKSLSKFYPKTIPYSEKGIREICSKFSAPYGYPSHSNPAAPGAILEGGELGYALSVAYGSVLDNPDLITCCLVGDGEAETGPMAAAWHINKLVNPAKNGAVLPIVHINGYKISGPTVYGRMSDVELSKLFEGYGYDPYFVTGNDQDLVHAEMAKVMDQAYIKIRGIQKQAREGNCEKPKFPVIILRTPKGWTGPKFDRETKLEGNCKSHQVVFAKAKSNKRHLREIEKWLKSYKFHELIEKKSKKFQFTKDIQSLIPPEKWSCGTNPHGFGGKISRDLVMPSLNKLAWELDKRGHTTSSPMKYCGEFLAGLFEKNLKNNNLRIFSPDETYSNKINAVFRYTHRSWQWPIKKWDTDLSQDGKVMEMLSEHSLFGLHHGYSVTGRHGVFVSYESFVQIIASMADQYVKFIKASHEVDFREPLPAVNVILTSLLERQDHNGFSHQNPSFISSMMEKDGEIIHGYFPPDANCMLVTMKEVFESRDRLNVIVAGKKDLFNWLSLSEAKKQMKEGIIF
jgi:xylulose-5-phosphate/fructose-6-phosphate phosphoketolase